MVVKKIDKWKIEEDIKKINAKHPLPIVTKSDIPKFEVATKIGDRVIGVPRETSGMAFMIRTSKTLAMLGTVVGDANKRKVVIVPKEEDFEAIGLHVKTIGNGITFHYKPFKTRMTLKKKEVRILPF